MKWSKLTSLIAIGLTCLVLGSALLLWFNLELLFTSKNLEWAQKKYLEEVRITWSDVDVNVVNIGVFEKTLKVQSENLCLDYKNSNVCFSEIDVALQIQFFKPFNYKFLKLLLKSSESKIKLSDFTSDDSRDNKEFSSIHQKIKLILNSKTFILEKVPKRFKIEAKNLTVVSKDKKFSISTSFNEQSGVLKIDAKNLFKLESTYSLTDFLNLKMMFKTKDFIVNSESKIHKSKKEYELKSFVVYKVLENKRKIKSDFSLNLSSNDKETRVHFDTINVQGAPYIDRLDGEHIRIAFVESGESVFKARAINLLLDSKKLMRKNKIDKKLFDHKYSFKFQGEFNEAIILGENAGEAVSSLITLKPVKNDLMTATGEFEMQILKDIKGYILNPEEFKVKVKILSFKTLADNLKDSVMAIPTPVNKFDGALNFSTLGAKIEDKKVCFPMDGVIDLKGPSDSDLDFNLNGKFCWPRYELNGALGLSHSKRSIKPSLKLDVLLSKFHMILPQIDPVKGIPNFTQDSRFIVEQKKDEKKKNNFFVREKKVITKAEEEKKSSFIYDINVKSKSKEDSPIHLKYKYFQPYMPGKVEAQLSNDVTNYVFSTNKDWTINYLDREIKVQKFKVSQTEERPNEIQIDVRFQYLASIYKIFIDVGGTLKDPYVKFSSSPFLSRNDIISVILYNRTSSELSQFESESVGSTEAAVSDRAIGLFGIWAFASTPIETVSYDSSSGVYAAQIGLPGGVKLNIGTNWETVQNLSLRKRISESWLLVTSFDPGGVEESVGNIFLRREWVY